MIFHADHLANLYEISDPIFYENRKMSENKVFAQALQLHEMSAIYSGKYEISQKRSDPFSDISFFP